MDVKTVLILLTGHLFLSADGFIFGNPFAKPGPGKPLFLSPYIARGDIQQAHSLSMVSQLPGEHTHVKSYSGFIEVQPQYNSNMFFWYIPAQNTDPNRAPLFLWLEGGPGDSSLLSLFTANGPYLIDEHNKLRSRTEDWTKKYSIVYVDNPVGTGFSFTDNNAGYARNQTDVARDLYSFLTQFFTLFPNLRTTDLYIAGKSYSGKYIPAIGYKIHIENPRAVNRINLKGLFMGAPFTDPETISSVYSDFIYYAGMFNEKERDYFKSEINRSIRSAKSGDMATAGQIMSNLIVGTNGMDGYFGNHTGYKYAQNVAVATVTQTVRTIPHRGVNPDRGYGWFGQPILLNMSFTRYFKYVSRSDVRRAIHVGETPFVGVSEKVFQHLQEDIMQTVKPWLIALLNSKQYKILIHGGQFDIIVCTPCIEAMIDKFDSWTDIDAYRQADKIIWRLKPDDKDVAGYVTRVGNFTRVIIRGSGHNAIGEQPERCMDMVTRFVDDTTF